MDSNHNKTRRHYSLQNCKMGVGEEVAESKMTYVLPAAVREAAEARVVSLVNLRIPK